MTNNAKKQLEIWENERELAEEPPPTPKSLFDDPEVVELPQFIEEAS